MNMSSRIRMAIDHHQVIWKDRLRPQKHRRRGATMMQCLRMDVGGRKSLEPQNNEVGVAINHAAIQMNNLEGSLVRSMIPINIPNWATVSSELKANLWETIQVRNT